MKRQTALTICIAVGVSILLTTIIIFVQHNHSVFSRESSNHQIYEIPSANIPTKRVIGLVSDGAVGSKVICFNTNTWEYAELAELPNVTPDNYVALSPNSKKLAYTTWDEHCVRRYLNILEFDTGKTISYFQDVPPRTEIIKISWMPDNETILYIRNNTELSSFQTIELKNTITGNITTIDKGEVWRVRVATDTGVPAEDFHLLGRDISLSVKYTNQICNNAQQQWNYYLDTDDLRQIYEKYGGIRDFDFDTILNLMNVEFSAPKCNPNGKSIVYSSKLDRNSAPGEKTPLWVAAAIWLYDINTGNSKIIYSQADEGAIGRVDWISPTEICFVSYYDFQGSRDNLNYYNLVSGKHRVLFPYSDDHYNNIALLPLGNRQISFASSAKNADYSDLETCIIDVDSGEVKKPNIVYKGKAMILENFISTYSDFEGINNGRSVVAETVTP